MTVLKLRLHFYKYFLNKRIIQYLRNEACKFNQFIAWTGLKQILQLKDQIFVQML